MRVSTVLIYSIDQCDGAKPTIAPSTARTSPIFGVNLRDHVGQLDHARLGR
jgi:hypothetical protein